MGFRTWLLRWGIRCWAVLPRGVQIWSEFKAVTSKKFELPFELNRQLYSASGNVSIDR